jgi:hypothetical protein
MVEHLTKEKKRTVLNQGFNKRLKVYAHALGFSSPVIIVLFFHSIGRALRKRKTKICPTE